MAATDDNRRTIRVALVSGPLDAADPTVYAENLVRGLLRSGVAVDLVAAGGALAGRIEEAGVKPGIFPRLGRRIAGAVSNARARARLAAFAPRVIHALSPEAWRAARALGRSLRLPAIVTAHSLIDDASDLPWPAGESPPVIAVSEALRENLVNRGGVPKSRVTVIRAGLDLAPFGEPPGRLRPAPPGPNHEVPGRSPPPGAGHKGPRAEAIPSADAEAFAPPEGARAVVGCISRLDPWKGVEFFVRAAKRILETRKNTEFVVAGTGPEERRLRRLASSLGVRKSLAFLGGEVRPEQVLRDIDVLVLPSLREALGIPALQAMAAAKPVVASGAGGVFEAVADGETGFLVQPGDAKALAERTVALLESAELCRDMGLAGREAVEKRFSLDRMVEATLAVYARAAGPANGGKATADERG